MKFSSFPRGLIYGLGFLWVLFIAFPVVSVFFRAPVSHLWTSLSNPAVVSAIKLSLVTTVACTIIAFILGTPLAYFLARRSFKGKSVIETMVDLPLAIPPAVAGVALLMAFGRTGILGSLLEHWGLTVAFTTVAVIMAQLFVASPLFIRAARDGFLAVNPELEKVSQTLGVSPFKTFWRVTLPLSLLPLLGGAVATWARALGEFGATLLFAGNFMGTTRTMPLAIMTAMESDLDAALVMSIIMIVLSFILLGLVRFTLSRSWERVGARP